MLRESGVDEVYVYCSTDLRELLPAGIRFLKRSDDLDGNAVLGNQLCTSFAEQVDADIYCNCFATVPFLKSETIIRCVNAVESGKYDSAVPVRAEHFVWYQGRPVTYDPNAVPRTQDMTPAWCETICYTYTRAVVRQNRRLGDRPWFCDIGRIESIDIDDEEDFLLANAVVQAGLAAFPQPCT